MAGTGSDPTGEPTEDSRDETDRKAAERRREQAIHAADDDPGENDDRVSEREIRSDEGFWTVRITLTVAARSAEMRTAEPITRSARTPSRRAVRKSIAAARMWSPVVVRSSRSTRSSRQTAATTIATIVILRMSTSPTVTGPVEVAEG